MFWVMLKQFFMWCTVINIALLIFAFLVYIFFNKYINKISRKCFEISEENLNTIYYLTLGIYKILIFIFNLVPFIVLKIMGI